MSFYQELNGEPFCNKSFCDESFHHKSQKYRNSINKLITIALVTIIIIVLTPLFLILINFFINPKYNTTIQTVNKVNCTITDGHNITFNLNSVDCCSLYNFNISQNIDYWHVDNNITFQQQSALKNSLRIYAIQMTILTGLLIVILYKACCYIHLFLDREEQIL